MADESKEGNEPSPIILTGIAVVPILLVLAWIAGVFG